MTASKTAISTSIQQILTGALALIAAGIIIQLQWGRLSQQDQPQTRTKADYLLEEQQFENSIDLLGKLPSLGYDNLIASWAFLNFVQYFGDDDARGATGYSVTPKFFEVAVERDPNFLDMYPFLSPTVTLYSGAPNKTIELLDKGLTALPQKLHPDAYFLWQAKATDELLFLGDPAAAQKSHLKAAEWASQSQDKNIQTSGLRSQSTANFLAENPDSRSAQVASWFNILSNAIDDRSRARAIKQIEALGGTVKIDNGAVSVLFDGD